VSPIKSEKYNFAIKYLDVLNCSCDYYLQHSKQNYWWKDWKTYYNNCCSIHKLYI